LKYVNYMRVYYENMNQYLRFASPGISQKAIPLALRLSGANPFSVFLGQKWRIGDIHAQSCKRKEFAWHVLI